jgi:hypothetical protein
VLFAAVKCLKPFLRVYHSLEDAHFINNFVAHSKTSQTLSKCYTLALSKLSRPAFLHHVTSLSLSSRTSWQ